MPRSPNVPRHPKNPVGQTQRVHRVMQAIDQDLRQAQDRVLRELESWPYNKTNSSKIHGNAFYEFLIDLAQITRLIDEIVFQMARGAGVEAARQAAEAAYREGTAKAVENLSGLSEDYHRDVQSRLGDQKVLTRATFAGARIFEEMEGFTGQAGRDLSRILFEAVQSGQNPKDTARLIRRQFGISKTRAERIARTEITGALRRGRWDEARSAQEEMGLEVRLIHYSALIPGRTRRSHAKRHGRIVTVDEQAAWYSSDANAINCLCTQTEVTVDENGEPFFGAKLLDKLQQQRVTFLAMTPVKEAQDA